PAVGAQTAGAFLVAANNIWTQVKASDFPTRAKRIASEIAITRPDIVNLQEVSKWTAANGPTAHEPSFDFLAILQSELAARGLQYTVASTSNNADIPGHNIPGIPLPPGNPTFTLTFQDRDVILVHKRLGLSFSNPEHANFTNQFVV